LREKKRGAPGKRPSTSEEEDRDGVIFAFVCGTTDIGLFRAEPNRLINRNTNLDCDRYELKIVRHIEEAQ